MAKRKRKTIIRYRSRPRSHRKKQSAVPLGIALPVAGSLISAGTVASASQDFMANPMNWFSIFADQTLQRFTGISFRSDSGGPYHLDVAYPTWLGLGAGILAHKFLGGYVNKYIKRVPLLGKYIEI